MTADGSGKAWSGRFSAEIDPEFERFSRSLDFDLRLMPEDVATNRAWAKALCGVGVLTDHELRSVLEALDVLQAEFQRGEVRILPEDEDVHMLVERWLTERLGPLGAAIHTGRSRNDQVVTDLKIYLRKKLAELDAVLTDLQKAVLERAGEAVGWFMPSYTHLQRAQPISFGHYLLALFWMLQRDRERIRQWRALHNTCPLGSGAATGSGFPVDRHALAGELGFDRPTENSVDAVSSRDFAHDAVHICASVMLDLSRYCEDWILWSTEEFGYLRVGESYATGSSMMPQKRNPDSLELIRGKAARVAASASRLAILVKGLPLTYNRDLQEDKEAVFDAIEQTHACVCLFAKVLSSLEIDPDRMSEAVSGGILATDLADYLVERGIPFREAHHVVGRIVQEAEQSGRPLQQWAVEELRSFSQAFEDDVLEAVTVEASLARRRVYGGTAPDAVMVQLAEAREILSSGGLWGELPNSPGGPEVRHRD